ncbi:MAG: NosD domain-containing protein [Candidatus Aenigmatarchaeota archaeon]
MILGLISLILIVSIMVMVKADICECNSCGNCMDALNNASCTEVRLTADIINISGTCINNPSGFNNKVFDCQGHVIDGDSNGTDYGIYLNGKQNNTIKNCVITDFYSGIYLYQSSNNNTIINLTSNSNIPYGVYLSSSSNNQIINSNLINSLYDFYIDSTSDLGCNNRLENVTGTDNKPIVYYNETINIDGWNNNFTELVLCNADYSTINNVTLTHISKKNNGILLVRTDYSNLTNVFVNNSYHGIFLYSSSNNNQIINSTSNSNTHSGILLFLNSNNNKIINSTSNSNGHSGIFLYSNSNNNQIINSTSNSNSYYGIYLYLNVNNNQIINSSLIDNIMYDFYIYPTSNSDCNNKLENVIGTDNKPIVYYNETINIDGWDNNFTELFLCNADYSTINNVTLTHTNKKNNGILIFRTDYSNLTNVSINNSYYGIFLYLSFNNQIINLASNSNFYYGIFLVSSSNNQIINSTSNSNSQRGTYLYLNSNNNQIVNLTSNSNSLYGIYLHSVSNNTIHSSIIANNTQYGIYIYSSGSTPNIIYNNFFNNTKNFGFEGTIYANNWNTTKTERTNIINGPYIGGNFWANPSGTGFSETCTDADEDGICDNPYTLTTGNVDYLPLKYISPCVIIFSNIKPTNNSLFELPQVNFSCEIYNSGSRRASCAINIAGLEVNNSANENIVNYLENLSALDYNFSHKEIFNYSDVYSFSCIAKNKINQTFTSEPYKIRIFINYEKLFNIKMIYAIILFIILSIAFIFFYLSMHYKEQTPIATGFLFLGFIFLIADLIGGIITLKEIGALTEALSGFLSVVTYAVGIIFVLLFMIVLIFGIVRAIKLTKKKKIREWGLLLDDEE